jgi:hypothetical protein
MDTTHNNKERLGKINAALGAIISRSETKSSVTVHEMETLAELAKEAAQCLNALAVQSNYIGAFDELINKSRKRPSVDVGNF